MSKRTFEHILKEKLHDVAVDGFVPNWAEMERRLEQNPASNSSTLPSGSGGAHRRMYRRLISCAALLALALSVGLYQWGYDRGVELAQQEAEVTLPGIERSIKAEEMADAALLTQTTPSNAVLDALLRSARTITPMTLKQTKPIIEVAVVAPDPEAQRADLIAAQTVPMDTPEKTSPSNTNMNSSVRAYSSGFNERAFQQDGIDWSKYQKNDKKIGRWVASAYSNTFASSQNSAPIAPMRASALKNASLMEASFTRNAVEMTGKNLEHHFPISVGFNIRRQFPGTRFGLETGVVYSYLTSSSELKGADLFSYKYRQKVHYLGVPVIGSYSFLQRDKWDLYALGGFMAEMAVSAEGERRVFSKGVLASSETERLHASGVLFSTLWGAGIHYDIVDNFGVYAEPTVNYYFPNSKQPITYRTDHPWSFNLRLGVRFKF